MLNQIGLNPMFNMLITLNDKGRKENQKIDLMDDDLAINNVAGFLNIEMPVFTENGNPLIREVIAKELPSEKNVVIIFMESMSAKLLSSHGATKNLTPNIDSIINHSLNFENIYSAGIHTNHGLYSTLYSYLTIMKRNSMKVYIIPEYTGLPTVLKDNGYKNMFFMTHESQYDNMNAFFRTHGYVEIHSQENYPASKVVNSFGVQDDYLFEYSLNEMNKKAANNEKFFATLLTISNHPPYVIPEWFTPKSSSPEDQIVEYADYCIGKFMKEASAMPWFDNTVFVFLGDHGKKVGTPESEMPDAYNHIPFFIYSSDISNENISGYGSQVDIAPTLLGLLNISYLQNNFGIDLLNSKRDCIFYTADNMMGCRNDSALFIYAPADDLEFVYAIKDGKIDKESKPDEIIIGELKNHLFSTLQATEAIVTREQSAKKLMK